jgi:hypothetical protein
MSQIRLYLDEDATHNRLLQALRNRGVDVISTATAGQISQSDEDQLAWALRDRHLEPTELQHRRPIARIVAVDCSKTC